MGKSIQSRALAHIHDPLAIQGRIDQAVSPQNFGNVRPPPGDLPQGAMADEAALSQCDQVVIHDVQMQALQVRNFGRNMDGKNLPLPARSRLYGRKTLGDKAAFGRTRTPPLGGFFVEIAQVDAGGTSRGSKHLQIWGGESASAPPTPRPPHGP